MESEQSVMLNAVQKVCMKNESQGDHGLKEITPFKVIKKVHTNSVDAIQANPKNEKEFASGSHDHTIKLWDSNKFICKSTLKGHEQGVWSLKYDAEGKQLVSASPDNSVRVWDVKTGKNTAVLNGHTGRTFKASIDSQGMNVISCGSDKILNYWDLRNQSKPALSWKLSKSCLMSCDFMGNDNQIITTSLGGEISIYSVRQNKRTWAFDTLPDIISERLETMTDASTFKPEQCRNMIFCCSTVKNVENDENVFMVGAQDKKVQKIRIVDGDVRIEDVFYGHSAGIRSIELSRDGTKMVSGCEDHSLRIWDYNTCEPEVILTGHHDYVTGGSYLNENTLVSSSWDCTIMAWKIGGEEDKENQSMGSKFKSFFKK